MGLFKLSNSGTLLANQQRMGKVVNLDNRNGRRKDTLGKVGDLINDLTNLFTIFADNLNDDSTSVCNSGRERREDLHVGVGRRHVLELGSTEVSQDVGGVCNRVRSGSSEDRDEVKRLDTNGIRLFKDKRLSSDEFGRGTSDNDAV